MAPDPKAAKAALAAAAAAVKAETEAAAAEASPVAGMPVVETVQAMDMAPAPVAEVDTGALRARLAELEAREAERNKPAPPAETVRVKLLKAYWPADGRIHPNAANRVGPNKYKFDAGDELELPIDEARKLLSELVHDVKDQSVTKKDPENDRTYRIPYVRPPIAVRVFAAL